MSRTYKDKPGKYRFDPWDKDRTKISYVRTWVGWNGTLEEHEWQTYIYAKTTKAKKRKEVDTEWHWMSTPSWWNHLMHTKKRRRAAKMWEASVLKAIDIEDVDKPNESNKPHQYFW